MIELIPIDLPNLRRLAAGESVEFGAIATPEGALPPRHVALRAVVALDGGTPAPWCVPYLMMPKSRDAIFGACGFKAAPVHGEVEISYGVAPSERRRGIATAAVGQLLDLANSSGMVKQVVANVLPENQASASLLRRLGFSIGESFIDLDGENVIRWSRSVGR